MSLPWPYLRNIPVKILELFPRFASVSLSWGKKRVPLKAKGTCIPFCTKDSYSYCHLSQSTSGLAHNKLSCKKVTEDLKTKNYLSGFHLRKDEIHGK